MVPAPKWSIEHKQTRTQHSTHSAWYTFTSIHMSNMTDLGLDVISITLQCGVASVSVQCSSKP